MYRRQDLLARLPIAAVAVCRTDFANKQPCFRLCWTITAFTAFGTERFTQFLCSEGSMICRRSFTD
jgi:hypothetical protein